MFSAQLGRGLTQALCIFVLRDEIALPGAG